MRIILIAVGSELIYKLFRNFVDEPRRPMIRSRTSYVFKDLIRHLPALMISICVLLPVLSLIWIAFGQSVANWNQVLTPSSQRAFLNTLLLAGGVGCIVILIGVGTAWLVTAYTFKTSRLLSWCLVLPLAIPTYIVAYVYLDMLHPLGPLQTAVREIAGITNPRELRLGDIRNLPVAILLLGFVLYPYVYLSARAMFLTQPENLLRVARSLGHSETAVFWKVALPMAKPAIIIGVSLALFETLNDIGASEFLGIQTVTVFIYTKWITQGDLPGAARLTLLMLCGVVFVMYIAYLAKKRQSFQNVSGSQVMQSRRLKGSVVWFACIAGWLPVLIGFIAPVVFLFFQLINRLTHDGLAFTGLFQALKNSLFIASLASVIAMLLGLILIYSDRKLIRRPKSFDLTTSASQISKLGYALPGTVLAIGLLIPFAWLDNQYSALLFSWLGHKPDVLLLGSIAGVAIACAIRFLGIAIGNLQAGMARVPLTLDYASRSLGKTRINTFFRIHLPLLSPACAASTLLIFVECMKELPATLLLRPLNTETLATLLYADAARGSYEDGSAAALIIVLMAMAPVIFLTRLNHLKQKHK